MTYAHPVNMDIPRFPFSCDFRDRVVIIRITSACKPYGDRDDAYDAQADAVMQTLKHIRRRMAKSEVEN